MQNNNKLQASETSLSSTATAPYFHVLTPFSSLIANATSYNVRILSQSNNKFITVSNNNMVASEDNMNNATVFTLVPFTLNRWYIQSTVTGKYATANSNIRNTPVVVNTNTASGWERFTFQVCLISFIKYIFREYVTYCNTATRQLWLLCFGTNQQQALGSSKRKCASHWRCC